MAWILQDLKDEKDSYVAQGMISHAIYITINPFDVKLNKQFQFNKS